MAGQGSGHALERAKREHRRILLLVVCSACDSCHVMAHESFDGDATAALMNTHFINVKVDRKGRPYGDAVHWKLVRVMRQSNAAGACLTSRRCAPTMEGVDAVTNADIEGAEGKYF